MPQLVQPARNVLYAAYNPIYAIASYPIVSREWEYLQYLNQLLGLEKTCQLVVLKSRVVPN